MLDKSHRDKRSRCPRRLKEDLQNPRFRNAGTGNWWDIPVYGSIFGRVGTGANNAVLVRDSGGPLPLTSHRHHYVPVQAELRYMYKLKAQIDGLYPTLGLLSGFKPIELLSFLESMKEGLEALGKSEGAAVLVLL